MKARIANKIIAYISYEAYREPGRYTRRQMDEALKIRFRRRRRRITELYNFTGPWIECISAGGKLIYMRELKTHTRKK